MANQILTDEKLVDAILSDKEKYDLIKAFSGWDYFAGDLSDNMHIEITPKELKRKFIGFFKKTTGISPYTQCPKCKGTLIPKKKYSYFVGCSNWPKCNFLASATKPYRPK